MKKILTLISISLMIILMGCSSGDTGSLETTPFIGGSVGLLISFAEGAPPPEVYDDGDYPFDIDVKLKNDGEYTIAPGLTDLRITGILADDFGINQSNFTHNVKEELVKTDKDSEGNIIEGSEYNAVFPNLNYVGNLSGNTPFTIRADVCYEYGTTANAKICVREDVLDATGEGVCDVGGPKTVFNSGSPVQIVMFEESAVGTDKIAFTFKIQKKGNGNVYRAYSLGGPNAPIKNCEDTHIQENKIYVKVDMGHIGMNDALECSGLKDDPNGVNLREGFVQLYGGERTVRCTLKLDQAGVVDQNFEKVANIYLIFDYEESVSTQLLVKHSATG